MLAAMSGSRSDADEKSPVSAACRSGIGPPGKDDNRAGIAVVEPRSLALSGIVIADAPSQPFPGRDERAA